MNGGQPVLVSGTDDGYLLVLSRDCRAIRDELISVALMKPATIPDEGDTFSKVLTVLSVRRDGGKNPDSFYLGPVPGSDQRLAADLRTPFVIKIPGAEPARQAWINAKRVARLSRDFIDHLHSRIFVSFARKGFDDHAWFPDEDLDLLVSHAEADEAKLRQEIAEARAKAKRAAGNRETAKKTEGLEKAATEAEKRLSALQQRTAPYRAELQRRRAASAALSSDAS